MIKQVKYLDFSDEIQKRGTKYLSAVKNVFDSGVFILSKHVQKFEIEFADYVGSRYCIGVANGLEAIQIALMALGIGKGDQVITTPLSAVATTLSILAVGATPVFVDTKENGQIDEELIKKAITKKTKGVLPVHMYGQPANLEEIAKICQKNNLFLIEDSAQAHGTKIKGKMAGTYGELSCFSFYPTKNLGAIGDGGAIVTNNSKLAKLCFQLRDYGQESKYIHTKYGLNSRLDELQAAILREKLKYLESDNNKRKHIAKKYIENLKNINEVEIILPEDFNDSNYHLFVVKTGKRDLLKKFLEKEGVSTSIHYPITIPDQPMFNSKYKKLKIPVARRFVNEILSLPCYPTMTDVQVDYVSRKIKNFFGKS